LGPTLLPLMLPFAVLAIPLIDLFSAIIRRLRAGQSPFSSDKEHMHHRILRAGNTHLRTTLIMYLWIQIQRQQLQLKLQLVLDR
jgi:UDP-GlcNAc:undecaprenyl-phosphate GlcNAc-1-phosphate transferase